jgi:hypothetical protein
MYKNSITQEYIPTVVRTLKVEVIPTGKTEKNENKEKQRGSRSQHMLDDIFIEVRTAYLGRVNKRE